jgi:hypothetical protein
VLAKPDADRILAGLTASRDRIAGSMYTVDTHPVRARLDAGTVTGETDRVRRALAGEVDKLWVRFGLLRDLVERASTLRDGASARRAAGRAGEVELEALLTRPVVLLDADGLPADPAAGTPPARTLTLADFAAWTESGCAAALEQLTRIEKAQAALTTEFARVAAGVDEVAALATSLGEVGAAEPLRAAAAEIETLDLADPLGAAPGGTPASAARRRLDALSQRCAKAKAGLAAVIDARDGFAGQRAALGTLIDEVEAAERAVAEAQARAAEKIAAPGFGPRPGTTTVLRGRLRQLDDDAAASQWRRVASNLSTLEDSAREALRQALEIRAAADGLIERRDELRGRLEAYRAKANASGLAENTVLTPLYARAHALLFTAPCDLRAATRAVHAYQTNLAGLFGTSERSPRDG